MHKVVDWKLAHIICNFIINITMHQIYTVTLNPGIDCKTKVPDDLFDQVQGAISI